MIVETADIELLSALESRIPEFPTQYSLQDMETRLAGRKVLALVSMDGEIPVGYKVGFGESTRSFYSWIGAVLPSHRRQGRAREMMRYQESWCREQGYKQICVWSDNRFRGMLQFLIAEGYDIFAVNGEGGVQFRKLLATP